MGDVQTVALVKLLIDFQSPAKGERLVNKVLVDTEVLIEWLAHGVEGTKSKRL